MVSPGAWIRGEGPGDSSAVDACGTLHLNTGEERIPDVSTRETMDPEDTAMHTECGPSTSWGRIGL